MLCSLLVSTKLSSMEENTNTCRTALLEFRSIQLKFLLIYRYVCKFTFRQLQVEFSKFLTNVFGKNVKVNPQIRHNFECSIERLIKDFRIYECVCVRLYAFAYSVVVLVAAAADVFIAVLGGFIIVTVVVVVKNVTIHIT